MTTDIPALKRQLTDAGLTHGPLHDALDRGAAAEAKLAEWQASQHYSYIGRDGKTVLARALEDRAEAAAALVEAQAEVARLSTLEGAADRVLRFITDPDRTTPWQALYKEMQKDRGDFPAMVRTFLEAFACADFRDELRRAALLPVARDEMEG
ncbi:MAG: hypothetical protein B7Z29_21220 [Hyphomicrobium sp. 12-62-95]|nr:MAG: hypothetical protein B7Z29_21220 [Hyphomicrobium sp. 12-62-95]